MTRVLVLTLLIAAHSGLAAGAELERLFFSPQERESLDRQRRGEKVTPGTPAGSTITGFVKRSDGKSTVWVDGQPLRATNRQADQSGVDGNPAASGNVQIKRTPEAGEQPKDVKRTKPPQVPTKPAAPKQPDRSSPQSAG
jgi:hypothetical protein